MKSGYLGIVIVIVLLSVLVLSCTGKTESPAPTGTAVIDYASLEASLRQAGATVAEGGSVNQEFFTVGGRIIKLNDEDVQVFEYGDRSTAEAQSKLVSPGGSSVGTSMITWVATPHFYLSGKLIVLYVGDNMVVKNVLEKVLGAQFAGG
ncbi:MAG: hypothetical protein A2Z29_00950 [Chloroflexi bacterium RBG_16_56_11]|nr:MAG: hypothetical protein A2Z29_00950 [Chloroflexi bacterium RBG_16_56_11]